jgi:hypothetical protein
MSIVTIIIDENSAQSAIEAAAAAQQAQEINESGLVKPFASLTPLSNEFKRFWKH